MSRQIAMRQVEALRRVLESQSRDLHTAMPGIVNSYDSTTQTAEIQPALRNVIPAEDEDEDEDGLVDLPILPSVPVAWPRSGGFFLHFPISAGDSVLVVFSELDMNAWRNSGDVSDPGLALRHLLSGAVAVPGLFPRNNVNADADGTHGRIGKEGDVFIEFRDDVSEIHVGGNRELAEYIDLNQHLNAIAAGLDALAARIAVLDSGAIIEVNYGVAAKAGQDLAAPIKTTVTKGT